MPSSSAGRHQSYQAPRRAASRGRGRAARIAPPLHADLRAELSRISQWARPRRASDRRSLPGCTRRDADARGPSRAVGRDPFSFSNELRWSVLIEAGADDEILARPSVIGFWKKKACGR